MTSMYAFVPAQYRDPVTLCKLFRDDRARVLCSRRDLYPVLPWALEDMAGTSWRNIWTAGRFVCEMIGLPAPDHRPLERPKMLARYAWTDVIVDYVGFWQDGHYVIDYWAREDHLLPQVRLGWYSVRLAHHRRQQARLAEEIGRMSPQTTSCYAYNRNYKRRMIDGSKKEEVGTLEAMRAFADRHGLTMPSDSMNVGRQGQLVLF